jgi:hypothetical protein
MRRDQTKKEPGVMCRSKAGIVLIPGVYVRIGDKILLGSAVNKASQSRPARPTFRPTRSGS